MPLSQQQVDALGRIVNAAAISAREFGFPPLLPLQTAQAILESDWLRRAPGNNPFGIKFTGRFAEFTEARTKEFLKASTRQELDAALKRSKLVLLAEPRRQAAGFMCDVTQKFQAYPTLADAFRHHAELITSSRYYAPARTRYRQDRDPEAFIRNVASVYATDPGYQVKLSKVLASVSVREALSETSAA